MEINKKISELLTLVKEKKPLIHHITNYVTVNDCANIVLALGGSPVMADAIEEALDMVSIASALVINIGTLNSTTVKSMIAAGKKANILGIPVILDPVGIGATPYRKEVALNLIKEINFSVIRGNLAEIKTLGGLDSVSKGVDSEEIESDNSAKIAASLAKELRTVIAITGVIDYISDGEKIISLKNGVEMLTKVTGTGCMTTSLIGTYCSVTTDYLTAAVAGIITMGISGEKAMINLNESHGSGSYRTNIIDSVYNFSEIDLAQRGAIYEN